jgi:hypothetical protein
VRQQVRAIYGASLSPDATAFAHLVDDGGYPRTVQRFLRGWRASSSRDVELPVEGPVTRVIHSADGYWLACEVAPDGGTRSQIWVVTTDPDDRDAHRIDHWPPVAPDGTAELIGWDGTQVAAILTGEDGVGSSCLINPADRSTVVLDRHSGGRLVDAWTGASRRPRQPHTHCREAAQAGQAPHGPRAGRPERLVSLRAKQEGCIPGLRGVTRKIKTFFDGSVSLVIVRVQEGASSCVLRRLRG